MKWDKDLIDQLIILINDFKRVDEISAALSIDEKAVQNKIHRLGLHIIVTKHLVCPECGVEFDAGIKSGRKFCCKSCANAYNNKLRVLTAITKEKISQSLTGFKQSDSTILKKSGCNNPNWRGGNFTYEKRHKIKKCRKCGKDNPLKRTLYCETCKMEYYEVYKPHTKFTFSLEQYPEEFDFKLIETYGWYSPMNKKNNLNGVSRDHIFSVSDGFKKGVDPRILSHPANCRLMRHCDNNSKNNNSDITFEELLEKIKLWDEKYPLFRRFESDSQLDKKNVYEKNL